MKLLFDHQLSPRLAGRVSDLFPGSSHVWNHGMDQAHDWDIWHFARQEQFTLVTKDSDFNDLSALNGFPPKVVWLRIGNCTTQQVEDLIRQHHSAIVEFGSDAEAGVLVLL